MHQLPAPLCLFIKMPSFWCFFPCLNFSRGFFTLPPRHQTSFLLPSEKPAKNQELKDTKMKGETSALLLSFKPRPSHTPPKKKPKKKLSLNFFLHTSANFERRSKATTEQQRNLVIKDSKNDREPVTRVIKI